MGQMYLPQCVMTPAGMRDLETKVPEWLHTPEAEALRELGVQFGVQLVGGIPSKVPECLEGVPVAIHAPNALINQLRKMLIKGHDWLGMLQDQIALWDKYKPEDPELAKSFYICLHGGSVGWEPSQEIMEEGRKFYNNAGIPSYNKNNPSGWLNEPGEMMEPRYIWPEEVTDLHLVGVRETTVEFFRNIPIQLNPVLENVGITNFYEGLMLPTHLDPRVGVWVPDMINFSKRIGCGLLCDTEHLAFSWNFFMRRGGYENLPLNPVTNTLLSEEFGWGFESGQVPWATRNYRCVEDAIRAMGARHFHVAGSTREWFAERADVGAGSHEKWRYSITSHYPIRNVSAFRSKLRAVLECKPITICTEVAGKSGMENDPFWDRRPELEVQEESWKALLEHLLALHEEGALPPR